MGSNAITGSRSGTKSTKVTKSTRKFRVSVFVFFAAFVIFVSERASLPAQPTRASWPQFRGDARLSGVAAGYLPAAPTLKWTYEAGETIESSAAIADGVVYVGA